MAGRPSTYTKTVADAICEEIAGGGLITHICRKKGMPDYMTFRRWRDQHPDFAERIARARIDQAEHYRDEICELNAKMNAKNWQYTNARIRNTQWLLGKLNAAQYGDKVQTEVTGPKGGAITVQLNVVGVKPNAAADDLD